MNSEPDKSQKLTLYHMDMKKVDLKNTKGACEVILLIKPKVMKTGTEGGELKILYFLL